MKHPSLSHAFSGLLLLFLLLFGVAATAAKLESDRKTITVGEITTVHLTGIPFIAVVNWKVSPELEVIESDKKHLRVRGVQAGTGKILCEMNFNEHKMEIIVQSAVMTAAPATAPLPAPLPAYTPPAVVTPTYTAPSHTPATTTSPQTSHQSILDGTWQINANGYTGKLELGSNQGMATGRVWFDAHSLWEPLVEMYFDAAIGELSFTRAGANQSYRGRLQDNTLSGKFTQWDGNNYAANPPTYTWSATRSAKSPGATTHKPATHSASLVELSWHGMNEDKVGEWGNGRPNGAPDGRFRLVLDLSDRMAITSISLWSATEQGDKAGGHIWHSENGSNWMLGVFRDGRQINPSHIPALGEFSGVTTFDLYANSSGLFNPGQTFLIEVKTSDGRVLSDTVKLPATAAGNTDLLRLDRDRFAPGEAIVVHFTAPDSYAANAWIGIIPSQVPHGSEAENDRHDIAYQYLQKRTSGRLSFSAPQAPGNYDFRMHDSDSNGKEVATVSFQVGATP